MKPLIVVAFFAVVVVVCAVAFWPTQTLMLTIGVGLSGNYDLLLDPHLYLASVPRAQLISSYSISYARYDLSLNLTSQILLQLNITCTNDTGGIFFDGRFTLDTLAADRIQMYHTYDPALRSSNFTLGVDARLLVNFTNPDWPDIDREFHHVWNLNIEVQA